MKMMKSLLLVAALCSAAHADSKAWSAAKKVLPNKLQIVGGANVGALTSSKLYQMFSPMLMAQAGNGFDKVKDACGFDIVSKIDSVAFGLDGNKDGAVVVALKNTTQTDLEACMQKIATADKKTFTVAKDGKLTKYTGFAD